MARIVNRRPADFPQTEDTWLVTVRKLRLWITADNGATARPFLTLIVNHTQDMIQGSALGEKPDPADVQKTLFSAITKPEKKLGRQPGRPAKIIFDDPDLQRTLSPFLQEIGIQAIYRQKILEVDGLLRSLETSMRGDQPEIPGLLSAKKTTVKIVAAMFNAAAGFFRAAPWVQLGNEDFLAVRVHPQTEPRVVSVMGRGGMEYGLAVFKTWAEVERMLGSLDQPLEVIPSEGTHSLLFNEIIDVPFDDLDDIEKYGWSVAGPDAYPTPMIYMPSPEVKRPDGDELQWYEAVLHAIPEFVRDHVRKSADGELQPVEATISVAASAGRKSVEIRFPAGELPAGAMSAFGLLEDWDELDQATAPFDFHMTEGQMARLLNDTGEFEDSSVGPKVSKAQDLIYTAWEERSRAKRIALAHRALGISADCADAYVLLAQEEATSAEQALEYYQKGVFAGERALGKKFFKKNAGDFWGLIESRPYMRAMEGKAGCLWELERTEEALGVFREMLRLNPGDNQGIRYIVVDLLLQLNRVAELEKLLGNYNGDWSAVWFYTEALLAFRKSGASAIANRKLRAALKHNPHVTTYLTGKKRIPRKILDYITIGGDTEAIDYATEHRIYWRNTPGAVEWLLDQESSVTKSGPERDAGGRTKTGNWKNNQ